MSFAASIESKHITMTGTTFETEMQVRPDDMDMNQHVHSSRYLDYVLAARYDQMARCYKMPMEEFIQLGFGWFIRTAHVEYKRPLGMGEWFKVQTHIAEVFKDGVKVEFSILKQKNSKLVSDGWFHYTMVNLKTGRAEVIPDWIVTKYSI